MKNTLFGLILIIFTVFLSCTSPKVTFSYLQSASINVPIEINKIVIVDHSAPKDSKWDILEGGLTGEGIGQDVEGVHNLIKGITEIGAQSMRYTIEREAKRYGKGKLLENIPEPMSLALIKQIGIAHQADAVLAIDKFDSDFITTNARIKDKVDSEDSTKKTAQYEAKGVATVTAYIRLYEVKTGKVLDEIKHKDEFSWRFVGNSVDDAVRQLLNKQKAVNQVSYKAGLVYGKRIAPAQVWVTRVIEKRPKNKSAAYDRGVRKAEVGDWRGAIEDFKVASRSNNDKVQGKAAYNTAVSYEVLGDLEQAQAWAQNAYIQFGYKPARAYQVILNQRIANRNLLIKQMAKPDDN